MDLEISTLWISGIWNQGCWWVVNPGFIRWNVANLENWLRDSGLHDVDSWLLFSTSGILNTDHQNVCLQSREQQQVENSFHMWPVRHSTSKIKCQLQRGREKRPTEARWICSTPSKKKTQREPERERDDKDLKTLSKTTGNQSRHSLNNHSTHTRPISLNLQETTTPPQTFHL